MSSVAEKVKSVIAEQMRIKPEQVTDDTKFVDDLGLDSLDLIDLVVALEKNGAL